MATDTALDLSVVIPARNEAGAIGKCLEALIAAIRHAGVAAQVIVVDNGSTDETPRIAAAKECRVLVKREGSIAALRNAGAREASGRLLAFLDADCIIADAWVSCCMEQLSYPRVGAVGTKAVPDPETATWVTWAWYQLGAGSARKESVPWLGTSNLMLRRQDFLDLGGFDERLYAAEDVDLCFRLRSRFTIRLEGRIDTLHLREATTLKEFFLKEMSRGQNSLECMVKNRFRKEDLPSVAAPALFLVLGVLLLFLVFARSAWSLASFVLLLLMPAFLMVRKQVSFVPLRHALRYWAVGFTFIMARAVALAREAPRMIRCRIDHGPGADE